MILSGEEIIKHVKSMNIIIEPFNEKQVGPNSYDFTLSDQLLIYDVDQLDCGVDNPTYSFTIPSSGFKLRPNELYLGCTNERFGSSKYVPWIDGRSSMGRLGLSVHITAGRGDLGFVGRWTLEITVVKPLVVYPNQRIGQVTFFNVEGSKNIQYKGRYQSQLEPTSSRLWQGY